MRLSAGMLFERAFSQAQDVAALVVETSVGPPSTDGAHLEVGDGPVVGGIADAVELREVSRGCTCEVSASPDDGPSGKCSDDDCGSDSEAGGRRDGAFVAAGVVEGEHDYEVHAFPDGVEVFKGEWDEEGVYFYQAYNDKIAEWAVKNQQFGGPDFNPTRMTWIKPSFAWVLYRAGYGHKHNQNRILKIKIPHVAVAELLSRCQCKHGGGGSKGRVQWDPARDLLSAEGREPRKMLRERAIQIGIKGNFSEHYVRSAVSIQDVTPLAHRVCDAHRSANPKAAMEVLLDQLPNERPYMPRCTEHVLARLRMIPDAGAPPTQHRGGSKKR